MQDLISRQAAIDTLEERIRANGYSNAYLVSELNRTIGYLMALPSADVQPVVRCKDCKYRDEMGRCEMWECYQMPDMGFCHEGVRKDG